MLVKRLNYSEPTPVSPRFYYDLGVRYEINGRLDDAETMYKKAIPFDVNDVFLKAISAGR